MLKSLEMVGFKSFADKTTFDFAAGITGIVGPNGSGKSNVVDAIKWILGDQSPKSLRGKEMTDVIFNGSGSRKPGGYAEATLCFDNSNGFLKVDADEVQISRRVYRSGESEYLINKQSSRLKDVRDLLLGTGAGAAAYSIIEQGRVASLLEANTQNRRIVFEEAAGIGRFKLRKTDALKKLERVALNLERLTDIVNEVGGQLTTLQTQAVKATKFREHSEELRTLRLGLAADDERAFAERIAGIETTRTAVESELALIDADHQSLESQRAVLEGRVSEVEDRLRAAERQAADARATAAGHEATINHQTARQAELTAELERLTQQQKLLATRLDEATDELQVAEGSLQTTTAEFAQRQAAYQEREQQLAALDHTLEQLQAAAEQRRADQLRLLQRSAELEQRAAASVSQLTALDAEVARTTARHAQLAGQCDVAQAELDRIRTQAHDAEAAASAVRMTLHEERTRREALQQAHDERQQLLAEQRERRSATHARKLVLDDLEQRQEGLGIGVKEILARAREGAGPPWDTIVGSVADLLAVELDQAALLEIALGARSQVIVVRRFGPLVEYLNSGKCQLSSRVGFLSLDAAEIVRGVLPLAERLAEPRPTEHAPAISPLWHAPGVVQRADRLATGNPAWQPIAERLLSDTWIVESLEIALRLASGIGAGQRYVTLQGELLEADGALYVGLLRSETALVSRKSELRGLKQEITNLDRQIADGEQELQRLTAAALESQQRHEDWQGQVTDRMSHAAELRSLAGRQEQEVEKLAQELDKAWSDLEEARQARDVTQSSVASRRTELADNAAALRELGQQLAAHSADQVQLQQQRLELREELAHEQLDLAKQEERLFNLQHARTRLDQERAERDIQRDEAERRLRQIDVKQAQITEHLARTRAALDELALQEHAALEIIRAVQTERDAARHDRSQLLEDELKTRQLRRELKDKQHALELQLREIRQNQTHLRDRIRDEYQLELADLAESPISALTPKAAADGGEPVVPVRAEVEEQIEKLRRKLKALGSVNTESLESLDELATRHERLSAQLHDLQEAKASLEEIVRRINNESKRMFVETFTEVRKNFQDLFRRMFGGGDGDIVLEDPDDVLECGIDIVARPPGKELRSISLMSGGEKTLTAFALLMAMFKFRPSPFCVLDEVDAPLDDANKERYVHGLKEFRHWTQFIVITHAKHTMTAADVLHGVTMEEAGVSKRLSIRFEDVTEDGRFQQQAAAA